MRSIRNRLLLWVFALVVGIFAIIFLMMWDFHWRSFDSTEKLTDQTIEAFFMGRWQEQAEALARMFAEQLVCRYTAKICRRFVISPLSPESRS